ncbi:hypothetical protein [Vibrio sp. D431a]|uniref:hypothetical protein n=1 Tax=Vibrio sp. D431a TaxID=2837388 RepID=UPI00255597A2|nr:hypothetical protein [Vibrio sp. D431a]MDK9789982.1 hypothetical protein [Vibrio sp. D431a]
MSGIEKRSNPKTEKIEKVVTLKAGEYWKAIATDESKGIESGEILLLSKIGYVDDEPHSITVLLHPSKQPTADNHRELTSKFLTQDFISLFEHVDLNFARAERDRSLDAIRLELTEAQKELTDATSDESTLDRYILRDLPTDELEKNLPVIREALPTNLPQAIASQQITDLMVTNLSEKGVENIINAMSHHQDIASRRIAWITSQTSKFTAIASKMTPFIKEKTLQPIAQQQDVYDQIKELKKGIANLGLYTLKGVEIKTLRKGKSAPKTEKLTVYQRPLFMDEEAAVWVDIEEDFDFRSRDEFFNALKENDSLMNQIFPTERCVLGVSTTRRRIDYEGCTYEEIENASAENARLFLLIRDGENVHFVESKRGDLEFKTHLFPSTDDLEAPFKGFDGRTIKFTDLEYSNRLSVFEASALTYKRFLILFCGLDHKHKLFGDFYTEEMSLNFVSGEFQEKYFNFIHDDDGSNLLANTRRLGSIHDWIKNLNSYVSKGSRVLVLHNEVMSLETVPSAYEKKKSYHSYNNPPSREFDINSEEDWFVGVVNKRGDELSMKVPLIECYAIQSYPKLKEGRLLISKLLERNKASFNTICLDRLKLQDAKWYLHDRPTRFKSIKHLRLLKRIIKLMEHERDEEEETRKELLKALSDGDVATADKALKVIDEAVAIARCAHNGKSLVEICNDTKAKVNLLNQMYELARDPEVIVDTLIEKQQQVGRKAIRISLNESGKYVVYSAPKNEEIDNRIEPFDWVWCSTYSFTKSDIKSGRGKYCRLTKEVSKEKVIYQVENIGDYAAKEKSPFDTPKAKKEFIDFLESYDLEQDINRISKIGASEVEWDKFACWYLSEREELTELSGWKIVSEPSYSIYLGYMTDVNAKGEISLVALKVNPLLLLIEKSPSEEKLDWLKDAYTSIYHDTNAASDVFDKMKGFSSLSGTLEQSEIIVSSLSAKTDLDSDFFGQSSLSTYGKYSKRAPKQYSIDHALAEVLSPENFKPVINYNGSFDELLGISEPKNYRPIVRVVRKDADTNLTYADYFDYRDVYSKNEKPLDCSHYDSLEEALKKNAEYKNQYYVNEKRHSMLHIDTIKEVETDAQSDFGEITPVTSRERRVINKEIPN